MGVRSFFSFFLFSIFWCISDDSFLFLINIGHQIRNALSPNETITPAAKSILDLLQLPRIIKKIFAFFIRSSDPMGSQIYDIMHSKTAVQDRKTVIARDLYREEWHKKWTEEGLDFVLTVPHAFPAVENGASEQTTLMSAGYTLIFNLVSLIPRTQKKKKKKNILIARHFSLIILPEYSQLLLLTKHSTAFQKISFNPKFTSLTTLLPRRLIQYITLKRCMVYPSVCR